MMYLRKKIKIEITTKREEYTMFAAKKQLKLIQQIERSPKIKISCFIFNLAKFQKPG